MHFHLTKPSFSFSFSFPSVGAFRLSKSVVSKYKCIDKDIPIAPPLPRPISKSPINQHREEQKQGQEVEELNELNLREKVLYLESIGVDSYRAVGENSQISTTGLESIESVVKLLQSMGIDKNDIGRLAGMCPEELTLSTRQLRGVFTFLLREAKIPLRNIKRRPRLLGCSVKEQLRPTLYFLQRLGITQVDKYSFLLSCSVEDKFIPRLDFIQSLGLSYNDAASMFVRFPAIFNYSIDGNLKPKFHYLMEDMGRNVDDLRRFPQYFAYSLEKRIKPRHRFLVENDVQLPLSVMLRASDALFYRRVKDIQDGSVYSDNCNELDSLYLYNKRLRMQPARNINEVINISSTESTGSSSLSKYQPRSINIQNDEHDDCSSVDNISVGSNNYNQNEISITTHNRQTLVEEVTSLAASVETRCERICATIANTPLHLHQIGDEDLLPLYVDTTHHKLEGMKTILREIAYEQHGNGDRAPQFDVVFKQYLRDL